MLFMHINKKMLNKYKYINLFYTRLKEFRVGTFIKNDEDGY